MLYHHDFSQMNKSFVKSSGRSVCYSTESKAYKHSEPPTTFQDQTTLVSQETFSVQYLLRQSLSENLCRYSISICESDILDPLHFWHNMQLPQYARRPSARAQHPSRTTTRAMSHRCTGLQASEARGLLRYTLVQERSTMFRKIMQGRLEWRVKT